MQNHTELYQLYTLRKILYRSYQEGTLPKDAYIESVKPIDRTIDKMEMAILKDSLVLQESFLQHILKP